MMETGGDEQTEWNHARVMMVRVPGLMLIVRYCGEFGILEQAKEDVGLTVGIACRLIHFRRST